MPELPEVETTKTSLMPLIGKTVKQLQLRHTKLRYPIAADLDGLVGYTLIDIKRRAKYLLLDFYHQTDNLHKTLLIHLGMSGSLQQYIDEPPRKHDHLLICFGDADDDQHDIWLHYHDPRRFGMILWLQNDSHLDTPDTHERFLAHLGLEPLDAAFDGDYLTRHIHNSPTAKTVNKAIKALIMDQSVVVGVGNIYAAESLFLSNIHPLTPACQLSPEQLARLAGNIKQVLSKAIEQGGSSLKDFRTGTGKTGYFQQTLSVYGRAGQPCFVCGTVLENVKITSRASVYCPHCQPYCCSTITARNLSK